MVVWHSCLQLTKNPIFIYHCSQECSSSILRFRRTKIYVRYWLLQILIKVTDPQCNPKVIKMWVIINSRMQKKNTRKAMPTSYLRFCYCPIKQISIKENMLRTCSLQKLFTFIKQSLFSRLFIFLTLYMLPPQRQPRQLHGLPFTLTSRPRVNCFKHNATACFFWSK